MRNSQQASVRVKAWLTDADLLHREVAELRTLLTETE
jgi:hypothetical protein